MKKLSRIAALFAASAMLFGAVSCSDGSSSGSDPIDDGKGEGGTSAWASSWNFESLQGVAANIKYGSAQVADNAIAGVEALTDSLTAFPTHSASGDKLSYFYCLSDVEYPATSGDLKMTILSKTSDTAYSFHNAYFGKYTATSLTGISGHTAGCLEICGDALSVAEVQGPFKVTILSSANGSSDKADRGAYIKVGVDLATAKASEAVKSSSTAAGAGDKMTYSYAGTDKVTVVIGCSGGKSIRVFDVKIEADSVQFTPSTNNATANDIATLGLIGTGDVTSSDAEVATAAIEDGKIKITSKKAGDVTLTVKDANEKTATIKVEVASSGAITVGTITKYVVAKPTVAGGELKATVTGSLENLVYATTADATDGTAVITAEVELAAGKYYFFYKATEAYAASEKVEVTVDEAGVIKVTYFNYAAADETLSYEGEVSDASALSCTNITYNFVASSNKDGYPKVGTNANATGFQTIAAAAVASVAAGDPIISYTFTVTALKPVTLKTLKFNASCGQTGKTDAAVTYKVNDGSSVTTDKTSADSTDKNLAASYDLTSVSLATNDVLTVTINHNSTAKADNKTWNMVLGQVELSAQASN